MKMRHVADATRKQALNALVFLYKKVLDIDSVKNPLVLLS